MAAKSPAFIVFCACCLVLVRPAMTQTASINATASVYMNYTMTNASISVNGSMNTENNSSTIVSGGGGGGGGNGGGNGGGGGGGSGGGGSIQGTAAIDAITSTTGIMVSANTFHPSPTTGSSGTVAVHGTATATAMQPTPNAGQGGTMNTHQATTVNNGPQNTDANTATQTQDQSTTPTTISPTASISATPASAILDSTSVLTNVTGCSQWGRKCNGSNSQYPIATFVFACLLTVFTCLAFFLN